MYIETLPCGPLSTNTYLAYCQTTREAVVIDPAQGSLAKVQNFLATTPLTLRRILLTHSHWDHIADVKDFCSHYSIPVSAHPLDAPNLEHPGSDRIPCWLAIPGVKPDVLLEEGILIPLGTLHFQVIHTPGHSPGGVCFFEPQQRVLFSGDTLFKGTIGNLSLPTGQPELMWPSLKKLSQLPHDTQVYPGHGPATTIGAESSWMEQAEQLFS